MNGLQDDVAVWSVELMAADIAALAAGTSFPQDFPIGAGGALALRRGQRQHDC